MLAQFLPLSNNMRNSVFDADHLKDYALFGTLAGIFFAMTVWFFLYNADYTQTWIMFIGSAFFMFVIMLFVIKLHSQDYSEEGAKSIVYAGHLSMISGIIVSVILCLYLTDSYKGQVLARQHISLRVFNVNSLDFFRLFLPGIFVAFLAGSFISLMMGYASKWIQPKRTVAEDLY